MLERPLRFAPLLVAALAALGCSDDSAAPAPTPDTSTGTENCTEDLVGPIDPTLLIDDFEDGDSRIAPVADHEGTWWLSTDMTDGTTTPPGDQAVSPEHIVGGRCGSKYAMRISGEGFTDWGASLIANFNYENDVLAPIDASALRGVRFWGRVGESTTSPLRVQLQDGNTYPQGGVCNEDPSASDACYNGFGTSVLPLDTEWRLYELPFERLGQRDFGLRTGALDKPTLYAIEFGVEQNTVFDFWVDDLWFYE